jgi:prepilin-type processing-associated H-X9-DG protein
MPSQSDPNAVGPVKTGDARDSRFQWRTPGGQTNPSLCATGHRHGMNVAMADGSCRTLTPGMDKNRWWALVTPAGGEAGE